MKELKDYIKVYENVVPKRICDNIITTFNEVQDDPVIEKHDTEHYKFDQWNLNTTGWEGIATSFIRASIPKLIEYVNDLELQNFLQISGAFEHTRVKKYYKSSDYRFDTHVDVADRASAHRSLVFMAYLNDNNGVTEFPTLDLQFTPKAGDLLVFPPLWMFPHGGKNPTDHDKFIMMSSMHYI